MSGGWRGKNRSGEQSQLGSNEQKQAQCLMQDARLSGKCGGARNS